MRLKIAHNRNPPPRRIGENLWYSVGGTMGQVVLPEPDS